MRNKIWMLGLLLCLTWTLQAQERPRLVLQQGHEGSSSVIATAVLSFPLAATASDDGTVKIWNLERKDVVRTLYDSRDFESPGEAKSLEAAVFAPGKDWVLTRDSEGVFRRFSLPEGEVLERFSVGASGGEALCTDGRSLYFLEGKELLKTDLQGEVLKRVTPLARPSDNGYFALSPDGRYLALSDPGMVWVCDTENLRMVASRKLTFPLRGLTFRPDSGAVTISSESAVADLELPSLEISSLLEKTGDQRRPRHIPFWRDGRLFLIALKYEPSAPLLEVDYTRKTLTPRSGDSVAQSFSFAPDGGLFLGGIGEGRFQSLADGNEEILQAEMGGFTSLAVGPGDEDFFCGNVQGSVLRWSSKTGRAGRVYSGLEGYVSAVAVSPMGRVLLAGDYHEGRVVAWDLESGQILFSTEKLGGGRFGEGVELLEFVDDDRFVVGTREGKALYLYSCKTKGRVTTWKLPSYPSCFALNSSGTGFVVGYRGGCMVQSLVRETEYRSVSVPERVWSVTYGESDQEVFLGLRNRSILRWDLTQRENKAERFASWDPVVGYVSRLTWLPDGLEALSSYGYRYLYSAEGSRLKSVKMETSFFADLHRLSIGTLMGIGERSVLFLNPETGARLGTIVGVRNNQGWVALDRSGEFDGNDVGLQTVSFELDGSLFKVDQFLNEYFRPGVVSRLMPRPESASSSTRSGPELTAQTLRKPPRVKILEPKSGRFDGRDKVAVRVQVTDRGAGASRVALIHNGHKLPLSLAQKQPDGSYLFQLRPLRGKNDIRATAFDAEGKVESRQARVRILAPNIQARPPRLHLLTVGIDKYSSGLSLKFAEKDAQAVSELFDSKLYERGTRLHLVNEKATLEGIKRAIQQISEDAEPQDAFVLYLAGHGTVVGSRYFFLPSDVEIATDESLTRSALSSEELGESLREVPATKQILVLDSCRSGAAVGVVGRYYAARSGLEEIRSQQLLARASGTFLVAATKAEDYAYEIPQLGHGVLTYAILEALGVKEGGSAKVDRGDGVTANELLQSVSARVPELSEKFQNVRQDVMQYSAGQDFLIAK